MPRIEDFLKWARANSFAVRLIAFYIAVFLVIGCYMPFLPVWLKWRGLDDWQIAVIYAVPMIMRPVFTPAMSFAADHYGRPVAFLKTLAWGTLVFALLLPFANGAWQIIAAFFMLTLFWMSIVPITEAITLAGARNGHNDYGRIRLWGSIAFVGVTILGGAAVKLWGPVAAIGLLIGGALSVVATAHLLADPNGLKAKNGSEAPLALPAIRIADLMRLVRAPELWLLLMATAVIQSAHSVYYVFGTLHWEAIHISPTIIGLLWATGVLAEITLFAYASRLPKFLGPLPLLFIGGMAGIVRWTVTAFDPPLPILFAMQALHGLTYGATHLGAIQFMHRAVPHQLAVSVQGLYASMSAGLVMGLVSLGTGPLHEAIGGHAYFAMAGICIVGLFSAFLLAMRWDGGLLITPTAQETEAA